MTDQALYQKAASFVKGKQFDQAEQILCDHLSRHPKDEIATSILASNMMQQGKTEAAINHLQNNVQNHPRSYGAAADLGFALSKSGQKQAAIAAFKTAVDLNSVFYIGWVQLAQLYYQLGDYDQALAANVECEKYDPQDQTYQQIQSLMQQGQRGQAEQMLRQMLNNQPGHPRAAFLLAHLAGTVGAYEQAIDIIKHGLDYHPANIPLRRALVENYEQIGAYADAFEAVNHVSEIQADYYNYWLKSRIAGHLAYFDVALEAADAAAGHLEHGSSELGKVDLLRGHALKILGRRSESEQAYRACIKNTPNNGAGWWGLADLKTYQFTDADTAEMLALLDNQQVDQEQRCQVAFALAKGYENQGDSDSSIQWYLKANSLRTDCHFEPEKHHALFQRLQQYFSAATLAKQASPSPTGPTPIFIVGMPRAGSTLIEQILASHSQIEGTMELMTMVHLERHLKITAGPKYKQKYPEVIDHLPPEELQRLGQKYLDETAIYRTDKPYFIDKLPPNFERIGLIHKILPQAIIIDARRHPMDCGFSAFKQHFASGHDYSYNLAHIGAYYNDYMDLMDYWRQKLGDKIITVQHEELLANPKAKIQWLLTAMGLDYEENCLNFHENKRSVKTASSEQVRQPINTKGIGQWRKSQKPLTPLIESLGQKTLEKFKDLPLGAGKGIL